MAVDVFAEVSICSSPVVSPRISFSHDLQGKDIVPIESLGRNRSDESVFEPTIDFDFCIEFGISPEVSSADELFADGKILPVDVKRTIPVARRQSEEPILLIDRKPNSDTQKPQPNSENTKKKRLIEFLSSSLDTEEEEEETEEEKPLTTKPFWQFRRSSSLNCETGRNTHGLIRSLQFLSRSNSTGSAPNQKPKTIQKQSSLKEPVFIPTNPSSSNSNPYFSYSGSKRASLRKNYSRSYSNGVRISPVLNIPPAYIAKGTVNLFGLGSLFCNGKSKKKKK